jgi:tetratricopeptide (TPR) repeat protein
MKKLISLIVILIILLVGIQNQLDKSFFYPYSSVGNIKAKQATLVNFWGVLLGARRLSADLAWINLLQYYGSHIIEQDGKEVERKNLPGEDIDFFEAEYKGLFSRCQTVVRIDPYFQYAYLYGGAALAFNQERYNEAIALLEEGVANNPNYWKFQLYLAAIAYVQKKDYTRVVPLLEQIALVPEAPTMLKSVLAQVYEKNKQYDKAKLLWEYIANTAGEQDYIEKAKKHLEKINNLIYK